MPIDEKNTTLYIYTDDEHFIPLDEISEVLLTEEDIKDMEYKKFYLDGEMVFEIKPPENYRELKKFIELVHPSVSWVAWWVRTYGSNNWRKMHGLPLIRRVRK